MCLSIPIKILKIRDNKAIIKIGNKKQEIDTQLVEKIEEGDFCLISNGFVVKRISAQEAKKIFNILRRKS